MATQHVEHAIDGHRPLLVDSHVHSTFSADAVSTVDAMCEAAVSAELGGICFTDHVTFEPRDECFGRLDFRQYRDAVQRASERWAGILDVGIGVEVDYDPRYREEIERFLLEHEVDFALGGVHWVDGLSATGEVFDRYGRDRSYRRYLQIVLDAVESGLFDGIAHLDFLKRYAFERYGEFRFEAFLDEIGSIIRSMIDGGIALEINTSGLRRAVGETLPGLETVRLYRRLGGELVTLGSDAHRAEHLGFALSRALDLARTAGFAHTTVFRERRPELMPTA